MTLGRGLDIGTRAAAGGIGRIGNPITTAASGDVHDDVDVGLPHPRHHFTEVIHGVADAAGLGVTYMNMRHAGTRLGGGDAVVGDLLGRDGHIGALAGGIAGAGDGTGQNDVAVHRFARETRLL
ncbi:hypothetical protein VRRI112168_20510 [Vreelandella rituensis]